MSRAIARVSNAAELDVERAAAILATCKHVDRVKDVRDRYAAVEVWLRHQRAGIQAQNDAAEIARRAAPRLGELLLEAPKAPAGRRRAKIGSGSEPIPTLADQGIDRKLASRAQKLAAAPEARFEAHIASVRSRAEKLTTSGTVAAVSLVEGYDSDEFYTPVEFIEGAREVMGGIDLDPASCELAQRTVRATTYYTKRDDGLVRPWAGRTWMNSPYSQPLVEQFAERLVDRVNAGAVTQAVALYNASTDTAWFHLLASTSARACFTRGRTSFIGPDGKPVIGNRVGQVFFYFGPAEAAFGRVFSQFGTVMRACG